MALPDLLRALREQAAEVRAAELEEARTTAARIRADSEAALRRSRRELVERARKEELEAGQRELARARSESAKSVLAARERLLERVRAAVERRIAGARHDPEYLVTLASDLVGGLYRLPEGPVTIRAHPGLLERLADSVAEGGRITLEAAPEVGTGFTASAAGGEIEIDATLESRLAHAWPRLAVEVVREVSS